MLADETIIFGVGVKDTQLAEIAKVAPSTIGRWRKDPENIKLGELRRLLRARGYSIRFVRTEREYE